MTTMRRMAVASSVVVLASLASPSEAGAVEHQHQLGLDPSLTLLKVENRSVAVGAGIGVHYTYGINDQFNVMAEGSFNLVNFGVSKDENLDPNQRYGRRPLTLSHVSAGIGYVIDVIRWVPYIGVLVGGYHLAGGDVDGSLFLPGIEAAAGLDYQFNRHWAAGIAGRQHVFVTALDEFPSFTTIMLRAQYQWGF